VISVALIGVVSMMLVLRVDAQSSPLQIAEGSGLQPLFVLDSGAAWSARWVGFTPCELALTSAGMTRDSIYLDARMDSSARESLTTQADLIAHDVAAELRKQIGGSESTAPQAGASVKWYSLPAELVITARPDGSMSWRGLSATGHPAAVTLLSAAMDSARAHGEGVMIWPEAYTADSIVLRLSLLSGRLDGNVPTSVRRSRRIRFLAFTIMNPVSSPVLPPNKSNVRYPFYNEQHGVSGSLLAQFVVDTNGKAIMSTFKDLWPADVPRLTDVKQNYYDDFVKAVRDGVSKETFTPARVGSCVVRQVVDFPVKFLQPRAH
jgi:hypothetical protein